MPRGTMRAVYIGATTAAVLEAVPDLDAGFLVRAVIAWALRDELPESVPPHLALAWKLIEHESRMMHEQRAEVADELHEKRAAAGRKGAEVANAAKPGKSRQTRQNPANEANPANPAKAAIETETETENTPANAGDTRAPATVDGLEPSCPLTDEEVTHFAPEGMTPDEIRDWRDYYESREWRIEPNAPRPMTRAAARASLRRWHTMQGVREAREAHLDAKADERHAAALAQRNGPPPPDFAEAEKRQRQREAEYAARVEAAKAFMP